MKKADQEVMREAASLLARLKEGQGERTAADDVLLFCYRLRDEYRIMLSANRPLRGPTFSSLNGLLYELESRPDETLRSGEWRLVIENLLHDIASGAVRLEKVRKA